MWLFYWVLEGWEMGFRGFLVIDMGFDRRDLHGFSLSNTMRFSDKP